MAIGSVARAGARPLYRGSATGSVRAGGGWAPPQVQTGWQPPVVMAWDQTAIEPPAAPVAPFFSASSAAVGTASSSGPEPLPLGPLADALSAIEALPVGSLSQVLSTISELGASQGGAPAPVGASSSAVSLSDPQSYFICQLHDSRFNPDAPATTADCGPTSLAMVLKAFGKAPSEPDAEALIDQVRYTMTGADDHNGLTTPDEILSAGQQYGLSGAKVSSVDQVEAAVSAGQLVVLSGNPAAYNTGFSSQQYYPFSGGHFIVVTGVSGDRVTIDDPLSHIGAISISTAQLQQYMAYQGWNEGIAFAA